MAKAPLTIPPVINQEYEFVAVDRLKPHPRNARSGDRGAIYESIQANGFFGACVVQRSTGHILVGNHRYLASLDANLPSVPVIWVDCDNDRALRILLADNKTSDDANYNDNQLAELLADLAKTDKGLSGTGWSGDELDQLISDLANNAPGAESGLLEDADADAIPDNAPTRCKAGDLWRLGEHRLLCGDNCDNAALARLFGDDTVDAVVTDPPYGIDAANMTLGKGKKEFAARGDWDISRPKVRSLLDMAPFAIIWGGNYFADELPVTNDWLCWHKKNDDRSFSEFELAWTNLGKNCRHLAHHWSGEEKAHPTQKPFPVMERCLSLLPDCRIVVDPYAGSGTTLIAAQKAGMVCLAAEIDPRFCDVIIARWESCTGRTAELIQ